MLKQIEVDIDVLTAARQRIINVFSNGAKVYLSMSGGKDSICLSDIVYKLIQEGRIDKSLLTVVFIDEEGMYDDVIEVVKEWRKKYLMIGVQFDWYCLETKHFNCLNQLQEDETFITWDSRERERWIRKPPSFAIFDHPMLAKRVDTYQQFLGKLTKDGFQMIGSRAAESVQRLINMSHIDQSKVTEGRRFYPIYDWKNNDVWLYLYQNKLNIPVSYMHMWQVGVNKNNLRISQFFSIDTVRSLVRMSEFSPDLMTRIERRQPNAYLACLYYDSEMFAKSAKKRKAKEETEADENRDFKQEFISYLYDDRNFETEHQKGIQKWYKNRLIAVMRFSPTQEEFKKLFFALKSGDPKLRAGRAITRNIKGRYNSNGKRRS